MTHELLPIASWRDTSRLALRLVSRHRRPLVAAAVSFVLVGLCALVPPWMLGRIVDAVVAGEPSIAPYAVAIAVAAVLGALFTTASIAFLARAGEPALAELREEVLDTALHLDAQRLEVAGTGDLISRVGDDARAVADSLGEMVPLLVNSVVLVGFTSVGLFALDWRLGLAGLVAAPFYVLGLRWYLPRSGPLYREERIARGELTEALVGGLHGAATLRAFGHEGRQLKIIDNRSARAKKLSLTVFRLLTRFFGRSNRAELIGLGSVLTTGFLLVRADAASVGAVTAAALYFHRLFNPIGALLLVFDSLQSTGAALARLVGVTRLPRPAQRESAPTVPGPLALDSVGHSYTPGRPVLAPTSLTIAPGERIAVVGATGAGKTTLGAIARGVLTPTGGSVSLAGHPYESMHPRAIRTRVALVSQDVHVFAGTLRDALTLAAPDLDDQQLLEALRAVGADGWAAALPGGLDTRIGDGGQPLAPNQAQQIALARVLLADPWFVVLDEATAEAGSAGARDLEKAALAATNGRGALIIAHRLTQAETADRILVLHEGTVVEQGTHTELLAHGGPYTELWQAWSGEADR
ncbi:ABC transporter ATP-binding protein [Streptosporangium amethystogenes]|uniref:ABC transporter ATP-binding protein n=1 Tax=Streptosporangium amethystogenes TaxID=2002 RepID=UPI0037B3515B